MIDKRGGERIPGTHGIRHSHRNTGMFVFRVFAYQQATRRAARDAHELCVERMAQPLRRGLIVMKRNAKQLHNSRQFILV
jgi:hypothetical protein